MSGEGNIYGRYEGGGGLRLRSAVGRDGDGDFEDCGGEGCADEAAVFDEGFWGGAKEEGFVDGKGYRGLLGDCRVGEGGDEEGILGSGGVGGVREVGRKGEADG